MYWYSVWRDVEFTYSGSGTSASFIDYKINVNGDDVFFGRCYRMSSAADFTFNVNKIVQQYCTTPSLPSACTGYLNVSALTASSTTAGMPVWTDKGPTPYVKVYVKDGDNWPVNFNANYYFMYDYDYEYQEHNTWFDYQDGHGGGPHVSATSVLENPICPFWLYGQLNFNTSVDNASVGGWAYHANAGIRTYETVNPDFWDRFRCGRYALIYVNLRGGIDTFPILGTVIKKENHTRYSMDRSFNNINRSQFEKDNYASTVATSYELNTHYLTDEESYNLARNLLGSNKVYLQDIERQFVCPVVITDSNVTYQTYQTNGKRLSQYIINVTESQSKIRR